LKRYLTRCHRFESLLINIRAARQISLSRGARGKKIQTKICFAQGTRLAIDRSQDDLDITN
jgi:hypothetical protein